MKRLPLSPLLNAYDQVLLDLDGCVWLGDQPTPGAAEAISELRRQDRRVAFVTNDARHGAEDYVRKLWGLGVQASVRELVTAGGALQHVLAERHGSGQAVVIGAPVVHRHVSDAGLRIVNGSDAVESADVVVVAGHEGFDYDELRQATRAVLAGAALLGSARDATYPTADGLWPGTGAILAAVETATGATAETVGKPAPQIFLTAIDRLGPGRTLVIGDRVSADLAGAAAAGLDGAIVLTGASARDEAQAASDPAPVAIGETLAQLVLGR